MGTQRQVTIKTLLLLTAIVAVQCATTSGAFNSPFLLSGDLRARIWFSTATGNFFWAVLPLLTALFVRSTLRVMAIGFIVGCLALFAYVYWIEHAILMADSYVGYRLTGILYGPFGCFEPLLQSWRSRYSGPMPRILGFSIYGLWLIFYTMAYMLFIKTCVLRQKTKHVESAPESNTS